MMEGNHPPNAPAGSLNVQLLFTPYIYAFISSDICKSILYVGADHDHAHKRTQTSTGFHPTPFLFTQCGPKTTNPFSLQPPSNHPTNSSGPAACPLSSVSCIYRPLHIVSMSFLLIHSTPTMIICDYYPNAPQKNKRQLFRTLHKNRMLPLLNNQEVIPPHMDNLHILSLITKPMYNMSVPLRINSKHSNVINIHNSGIINSNIRRLSFFSY